MNLKTNLTTESSTTPLSKSSYSNSITGASCLLCVSPEAIQSFLESKEKEYIEKLERDKKHLTNTVHRLMKDRQRIMDSVKELFSEVKE
jgi:hypothetical protein